MNKYTSEYWMTMEEFWGDDISEQPTADLGGRTYVVEMYPTHTDVEYIQWTQITPQLQFEQAHTVSVTLGQCAPGYRYRITKITRED